MRCVFVCLSRTNPFTLSREADDSQLRSQARHTAGEHDYDLCSLTIQRCLVHPLKSVVSHMCEYETALYVRPFVSPVIFVYSIKLTRGDI